MDLRQGSPAAQRCTSAHVPADPMRTDPARLPAMPACAAMPVAQSLGLPDQAVTWTFLSISSMPALGQEGTASRMAVVTCKGAQAGKQQKSFKWQRCMQALHTKQWQPFIVSSTLLCQVPLHTWMHQGAAGSDQRHQRAHLYAHVPDQVSWDGVSRALVYNLHADGSATFGLQSISRQILGCKCAPAAPVGRLPAELAVGVQAAQAPGSA